MTKISTDNISLSELFRVTLPQYTSLCPKMTSLIDGFVSHLETPSMDLRAKLNIATELRDSIELNYITTDQEHFVSQLLPLIIATIEQTPISMISTSPEHKLRHCLLDCLCRLQFTETFKPAAITVMQLIMQVARIDNEENGVLCLKALLNLHKAYKASIISELVKPFFDLYVEIIGNVPQMLRDLFDVPLDEQKSSENELSTGNGNDAYNPNPKIDENGSGISNANAPANSGASSSVGTPKESSSVDAAAGPGKQQSAGSGAGTTGSSTNPNGSSSGTSTVLNPATRSFKVLIECPIIIVSLFHGHKQLVTQAAPQLIPHTIELLNLEASPQASEHASAAQRGTFFAGVAPAIRVSPHRTAFHDFVVAQIKAMSFIAYVVRGHSPVVQRYLTLIPNFLIRLFKDCPPENSIIRRELIVALRHIINTEHRTLFLSKINILLEERVLVGYGLTCNMYTRFVGYSVVADLIYHVRDELNINQIWQAVRVYTKLLLDPTLTPQSHVMTLRLLVNVLDRLGSMPKPDQNRQLVCLVMKLLIDRIEIANRNFDTSTKAVKRNQKVLKVQQDAPHSDVKDAKFIFRSLAACMCNLATGLKATNPPPKHRISIAQWHDLARGFTPDDINLLRKMLHEVLNGLKLFHDDPAAVKNIIDNIAAAFAMIDTATLIEIFESEIPFITNKIVEYPEYLHLSDLLTSNEITSNPFCSIMLAHLMERLPDVGKKEGGTQLLALFRQCLGAVDSFPAVNESMILVFLRDIIVESLKLANDAEEPQRYFSLLQHLFRTLSGGRFDNVYKTMLPLLHFLLETLNKRLFVARTEEEKNTYAELCLTVPVRLSLMVPHLSFLINPLSQALVARKNPELIAQGLRTLELCVDNLTPVYFDPHIAPAMPKILPALWSLLKPLPFDHKLSHTTLRILGKLGGRSRAYIKPPADLKYVKALDQDVAALVQMKGNTTIPIRITPSVQLSLRILGSPSIAYAPEYRSDAFKIISMLAMKLIPSSTNGLTAENVQRTADGVAVPVQNQKEQSDKPAEPQSDITNTLREEGTKVEESRQNVFSLTSNNKKLRKLETDLSEELLKGLFLACGHEEIRDEAKKILTDIGSHLVLLEMVEFNDESASSFRPLNVNDIEPTHYIKSHTFLSAVVFGLTHWLPGVSEVAESSIRELVSTAKQLCGEEGDAPRLPPVFRVMYAKLCHACFEEAWYTKLGAVKGLSILLKENKVPEVWMRNRTLELVRTLFFVIKDSSPMGGLTAGNVPSEVANDAISLLHFILAKVEHYPDQRYFLSLLSFLAIELEGACKLCRETSQSALEYLGEQTKIGVSGLLEKVTAVFLNPIFMKPLRALPFPTQIGYTDCIAYCMKLPNTFLKYNEKLTRMIEEALALVDADDESLIIAHRGLEYTTGQQLTELRVVCIQMLALTLVNSSEEFISQNQTIKNRIIAVFFKSMGGGPQPAIDAAYDGIKAILHDSPHNIPRELLQSILRPLLMPLGDFKRLNTNMLNCLSKLLESFTGYLKVEIGTKLLHHLRTYSEPPRLLPLSYKALVGDPRVQIGLAIINVFHMLPPTAHIFLADLVGAVVNIESILRRTRSPFREPLAKYLDKYPTYAFTFFADKLTDPVYGQLFADMLTRCPALKKHTMESNHVEEMCNRIMANTNDEEQCIGVCNLVGLSHSIDFPRDVLMTLVSRIGYVVRTSSVKPINSSLQISVPYAIDELQRAVIGHLSKQHKISETDESNDETNATKEPKSADKDADSSDLKEAVKNESESKDEAEENADDDQDKPQVDNDSAMDVESDSPLTDFELIQTTVNAVANSGMRIVPDILEFLWRTVINVDDIKIRQDWLEKAIPFAINPDLQTETKQYMLLISNMILMIEGEKRGNLDALVENSDWINMVNSKIWQNADKLIPSEGKPGNPLGSGLGVATLDIFIIRLLEMSILLVQNASSKIVDMRKNVIKFGWRYITVDDAVSKMSAYVQINYFVKVFDTLPKIVIQIYLALLKMTYQDARSLVQQALDILASVIVQRVGMPVWTRAPRRVLSEDTNGVSGVTNVYIFLQRHSELFFPYRELYVPYIVSSMARLSSMSGQTLDVDLAELLAFWEQQRHEEIESGKSEGYDVPHATREAVVTYLVRFITAQSSKPRDSASTERVMVAMDKLLQLWPDVEVQLNFFDRTLAHTDFGSDRAHLMAAIDALKFVNLALKHQKPNRIEENMEEISQLLAKPLLSSLPPVHDALRPVLKIALSADTERVLLRQVVAAVIEHLSPTVSGQGATAGGITGGISAASGNIPAGANSPRVMWVYLATEAVAAMPNCLDEHMPLIIKAMSRMAKEKLDVHSHADTNRFISVLKLIGGRVSFLGDQRRSFLTLVAHIIERVPDKDVALFILDMVDEWVFGNEPFPTIKEEAAILSKLLFYKDQQLTEKYFDIIIRIFENPKLRATELPSRLEQPFLVGCTSSNITVRNKLLTILSNSIDEPISKRLFYVLCEQNWEALADQLWLCQALQLLLTPIQKPTTQKLDIEYELGYAPVSVLEPKDSGDKNEESEAMDVEPSQFITVFTNDRKKFMGEIDQLTASDFVNSVQNLMFLDNGLVEQTWLDVFPAVYKSDEFASKERHELVKGLVNVLAKEYHMKQADARPNVVQCLLSGLAEAGEQLPPQLSKYLATNYDTWYTAIQISENIMTNPHSDSVKIAETNEDVLAELYAALGEEDHFYGLWRTRSKFNVTSSALSYEQCGMWQRAMELYETAQIRARSGLLAYGDSEYGLWEDHWILCAEKLQHWEVLTDIAKHEGFTDLLLECQWRLADWVAERDSLESTIKTVMDVPTPRRQVFETFLSLQGIAKKSDTLQHLSQNCDEGIQLALRKWHSLPTRFTPAHAPLLHTFQQYVEFMEATQVYTSLQSTTPLNVEAKSQELRGVMQAWHDRLPNAWDDINWWGDLAAWRQHVFGVINRTYLPLFPQLQANQGSGQNNGNGALHSAAYRGYHEIAWTINRFAHTARKQNLTDVCTTQLSKIYTLPNIEIQEAFLKLLEQAKCHLQNPNELATGLDVISNTNLAFFSQSQKAEFFALKGLSLGKLGQYDAAYDTLSTAVQVDIRLPNAWDAWGEFSDRRFKENPDNYMFGASAITCYLQAIFLYKNSKSRKLIGRVLWLLGLDDPQGKLGEAFEEYKGETATWYWVTYIPQMLTSLSTHEGKYTSRMLMKIAKAFPQSLHFQLRVAKEEYLNMQRISLRAKALREAHQKQQQQQQNNGSSEANGASNDSTNGDANDSGAKPNDSAEKKTESKPEGANAESGANASPSTQPGNKAGPNAPSNAAKEPWDYAKEITGVLKTAYPLLTLSLETLIDQINKRFRSTPEEEVYRLIQALLTDALNFVDHDKRGYSDNTLPAHIKNNVIKFSEGIITESLKPHYKADFIDSNPTLDQYIARLRKWRGFIEERLDARPYSIHLESLSPHIVEYNYQTLEEVEIPGQSLDLHDDNRYFYKIGRFVPLADFVRGHSSCYRRITIQATDGSLHPFAVQQTNVRHTRREDRVTQIFKILSEVMQHRTETRRRNIRFTLPNVVMLNINYRLVQDDSRYVNFYQIYERYCRKKNMNKDAPIDFTIQQLRAASGLKLEENDPSVRLDIFSAIQNNFVPQTIMRDFFIKEYRTYEDFWLFRRQFAYQYACASSMAVILSINARHPHKFQVNMSSGNVWATDMLPIVPHIHAPPQFLNGEPVAFRMTPNLQHLLGPSVAEGLFAPLMMLIGKSITDPQFDLQQFLPLFVRDEIISFYANQLNPEHRVPRGLKSKAEMQEVIKQNVEMIDKRAASLWHPSSKAGPNQPADQKVLELYSKSVNVCNLVWAEMQWMPYY